MADQIRVRILAAQRVRYDQTVTMTPEEWAEFKATPAEDLQESGGGLEAWLDLANVSDAEDFDDFFEAFVVDATGKKVTPRDEYEGE
jgi:hypothetical protein